MRRLKYISTRQAQLFIKEETGLAPTLATIRNWCKSYGGYALGRKIGGRWWVDKTNLEYFLEMNYEIGT